MNIFAISCSYLLPKPRIPSSNVMFWWQEENQNDNRARSIHLS